MAAGDIDWDGVERVLVIRLRSIGDTVLATPSLIALRRLLPNARIDILLEDWVAPLLDGFDQVDNVFTVGEGMSGRLSTARRLRKERYDVAINLHGGTTATLFTAATRARYRIGYAGYQYSFLYNRTFPWATEFWGRDGLHSAEQQLGLLGLAGIPVGDRPRSRLAVTADAAASIDKKIAMSLAHGGAAPFALLHPAAAFETKRWPAVHFARTAEFLATLGIGSVAVASRDEAAILQEVVNECKVQVTTFDGLTLPEITALAAKASLFVGNDSGIAHIAAAVDTPVVVIFGSSNRDHWRPWGDVPAEVVFQRFACQPCPGYTCEVFGEPRCILSVETTQVFAAIERSLATTKEEADTRPAS